MLGFDARLNGLRATLSVKMAQDDLHIVDSLDQLPTDDPKFLEELVEQRGWGPAVLFVDESVPTFFRPNPHSFLLLPRCNSV